MKIYNPTRDVLADVERVLADNRPSPHFSPLDEVTDLLCRGRHYSSVFVYLAFGSNGSQTLLGAGHDPHPGQLSSPETRRKILVSMRIGGREVGVLAAESEREDSFGSEDRVLLEAVAARLAKFLTGPGQYLVRRTRDKVHSS